MLTNHLDLNLCTYSFLIYSQMIKNVGRYIGYCTTFDRTAIPSFDWFVHHLLYQTRNQTKRQQG